MAWWQNTYLSKGKALEPIPSTGKGWGWGCGIFLEKVLVMVL